jgi:hypothetical protein
MSFDETLYGRDDEADEFGDSGAYGDALEEDYEEEEEEEEAEVPGMSEPQPEPIVPPPAPRPAGGGGGAPKPAKRKPAAKKKPAKKKPAPKQSGLPRESRHEDQRSPPGEADAAVADAADRKSEFSEGSFSSARDCGLASRALLLQVNQTIGEKDGFRFPSPVRPTTLLTSSRRRPGTFRKAQAGGRHSLRASRRRRFPGTPLPKCWSGRSLWS